MSNILAREAEDLGRGQRKRTGKRKTEREALT